MRGSVSTDRRIPVFARLALHPDWSPSQVLERLSLTTAPIDPSVPEATRDDGAGILDLAAALRPEISGDSPGSDPAIRKNPTWP